MQRKDIDFLEKKPNSPEEMEAYIKIANQNCEEAEFKAPHLIDIAVSNPEIACHLLCALKVAKKMKGEQLVNIYMRHCENPKFIETMTREQIKNGSITLGYIISKMSALNVVEIFKTTSLLNLALEQLPKNTNKDSAIIILLTKAAEYDLATLNFFRNFLKQKSSTEEKYETDLAEQILKIYRNNENNLKFKAFAESKEFPQFAYLPIIFKKIKDVNMEFAKKDFFMDIYRNQKTLMNTKDTLPSRPFFAELDDPRESDEKGDKKSSDAFKNLFGRQ